MFGKSSSGQGGGYEMQKECMDSYIIGTADDEVEREKRGRTVLNKLAMSNFDYIFLQIIPGRNCK